MVEACSVGVPHEPHRIVRVTEVDWNIVAIDGKYRHFLDVVASSSPDVRVEREQRDIRRPYRHVSIGGRRHLESTQPRHPRQWKQLVAQRAYGVLTIQGSSMHGSAIHPAIHSQSELKP